MIFSFDLGLVTWRLLRLTLTLKAKFSIKRSSYLICDFHGGIAQLVERLHGMQEASGSNPLISTLSRKKPVTLN